MTVIAVEGLDASGKSTIAILLSKRIGGKYIEKPMRWLLQNENTRGMKQYYEVINRVNALNSPIARQWFYCLGWLLLAEKDPDSLLVLDRYVLSNLSYNFNSKFNEISDIALNIAEPPVFTVLLTVSKEERRHRIMSRQNNESEIENFENDELRFNRMKQYLAEKNWPHLVISTENADPVNIVEVLVSSIKKHIKLEAPVRY